MTDTDKKIAFLALDDLHHLHHIAPIAFQLSYQPGYQSFLYIQAHAMPLAQTIASCFADHHCQIQILTPSWWHKCKIFFRGHVVCGSRSIIHHHAKELIHFDALVSPDMDLKNIMQQTSLQGHKPLCILTFHGSGDRLRPYHLTAQYDLVLLAGIKDQRRKVPYLRHTRSAIVGYPKFDVIPANTRPNLFVDHKPVIIYNPHSDLSISSWGVWGLAILEYFYQQKDYNFIFAPHCNLFRRNLRAKQIPEKYFTAPHMIIDLGSEKSVDMTYTRAADIYLGDVSSQVYEFIREPRPCLFLNAHQIKWEGNAHYACWNFGTVICELAELDLLLKRDLTSNFYFSLQQQYFCEAFATSSEKTASEKAAATICEIFA